MGNIDSHDYLPVWDPEHKELDLRHSLSYDQFCKHVGGKYSSECLSDLPSNILEEISLYETLNASFNCMTTLPSALPLHLPHLSHLDLSYNNIIELPHSFGLFFHLRTVLLHHNRIRNLPESFIHLRKLEKIDLSYNKLAQLPSDIDNLEALEKLNVSNNRLKSIPKSVIQCKSLKVILAHNNYCEEPPQDICDLGSQELLGFLRKNYPLVTDKGKTKHINVFPRICGNRLQSSILNSNSPLVQYVQLQTKTANTPSLIKTPLLLPIDATEFQLETLKDKILGLIYGALIGDALGVAGDFMTPDECLFHYNASDLSYSDIVIDDYRVHWSKQEWTSHGDHMLLVLDSIVHWAGVVDELDFAERLLQWKTKGLCDDDDYPGYSVSDTINKILELENFKTSPHLAASSLQYPLQNGTMFESEKVKKVHPSSVGVDNAALPRAIILGVPHFYNFKEVISNSVRICKASHSNPQCVAANVAVSLIVSQLLQGHYNPSSPIQIEELLNSAKLLALEQLEDSKTKEDFHKCFTSTSFDSHFADPDYVSHPFTALQAAVFTLQEQKDFKSSLTELLMKGGHSSANCCLAGAFLGCCIGYSSLTSEWVQDLSPKRIHWLNTKINSLLDMLGIP